jgi:hypothetical protein
MQTIRRWVDLHYEIRSIAPISLDAEIPLTLEQGNTIAIGKITKLITEPTG